MAAPAIEGLVPGGSLDCDPMAGFSVPGSVCNGARSVGGAPGTTRGLKGLAAFLFCP